MVYAPRRQDIHVITVSFTVLIHIYKIGCQDFHSGFNVKQNNCWISSAFFIDTWIRFMFNFLQTPNILWWMPALSICPLEQVLCDVLSSLALSYVCRSFSQEPQQTLAIRWSNLCVAWGGEEKKKQKKNKHSLLLIKLNCECKVGFVIAPSNTASVTSSSSLAVWATPGRLFLSLSLLPCLNPSLLPYLIPPPLPPLPPLPLPVWVTPGWVSLWSWDGFFLLTRALPDNTAQPDTNIIKNEELLVRVPANADMKWKVGERRDGRLTVQRERLKNSQWGPVRSAEGPMARSCADASQTGVFFYLFSPPPSLCTFLPPLPFSSTRVKNS